MTGPHKSKRSQRPLLLLMLALLIGVAVLAVVLTSPAETPVPVGTVAADTYAAEVAALLDGADPVRGEQVSRSAGCAACHVDGVGERLAPSFYGIADTAATRRPPLSAAAYLYEAVVYPQAHMVEGYNAIMPTTYGQSLSRQELGDVLAYLLAQREEAPS